MIIWKYCWKITKLSKFPLKRRITLKKKLSMMIKMRRKEKVLSNSCDNHFQRANMFFQDSWKFNLIFQTRNTITQQEIKWSWSVTSMTLHSSFHRCVISNHPPPTTHYCDAKKVKYLKLVFMLIWSRCTTCCWSLSVQYTRSKQEKYLRTSTRPNL